MPIPPIDENSHWEDVQILKRAFDCSPDNIYIIDPESMMIVDANQTALDSLGYTKEELLKLGPHKIDAVFSYEMIKAAFDSIFKSKEQHAIIPTMHRRKDNTTFEVEVYLRCFKENGYSFILASATNTSLLKKAQDELKFDSALFKNISDAVVSTDRNFCITSWNKHAEEIFGWTENEAIGKTTRNLTAAIYPGATSEEVEQLLFTHGFWRGEIFVHKKDGGIFPALISVRTIKDLTGSLAGTVSIVKDISKQKERDQQITYLADLVDKVHDAIISLDEWFKIKTWNKGAENIFGYKDDEAKGRNLINFLTRDYPADLVNEIIAVLQTSGYWEGELKQYHKTNAEIWTLVSATTLVNENGVITGYVIVGKEISERKKLEEQLKKFNEELEQRVKEKTQELVSIFERITDGFIALDNNWNFTYVNKEAGHIYYRDPQELIGQNIWKEFPEAINHPFYEAFHTSMNEQKTVEVNEYYLPLGKWLQGLIYPSENGVSAYFRDITDRKEAELALEESEQRYRKIVETVQEGIWQIDENNTTTFVNQYMASLLGYAAEEIIGKNVLDFLGEQNREVALRNVEDRKKGISVQHEYTLLNSGQQQIHTLVQSTPLFKEGRYAGSISMFLDITKRKQAEERLQANEKRFRALIENSSDGITLLSSDCIVLDVSPSSEKILGYKKEEIIGKPCPDFFHSDDAEKIRNAFKYIMENPSELIIIEYRHKMADGSYKWIECDFNNQLDEPYLEAVVLNYRDISYRKKAEEELRLSEQKYRILFENNPLPLTMLTYPNRNFVAVNEAYITKFGYSREEFSKMTIRDLRPPGEAYKSDEVERALNKEHRFRDNMTLVTKDGSKLLFDVQLVEISFEGKRVYLTSTNDITEQKKAQEDLIQMNDQLRELASHLQNIREEERTNMAREIHDELGQQLTVLKMDISWLNKKLTKKDEVVAKKIKGVLELIDGTINTVRKISAELRPSILDDFGVAEAIEWQSTNFTKHTGIPVEFSSNVNDYKFSPAISTGLFRIFQESLTNVSRHAQATKVVCTLKKYPNCLKLTISDDGVGFDVNKKGERKTLGLLGVKERVLMLDGKFNIASEPGKGTAISVELPLLQIATTHK
ncbi:MAG: domain S-box protein [Segetibacter sp.]|nr:domain S-box protein [Segetibacter sp.]